MPQNLLPIKYTVDKSLLPCFWCIYFHRFTCFHKILYPISCCIYLSSYGRCWFTSICHQVTQGLLHYTWLGRSSRKGRRLMYTADSGEYSVTTIKCNLNVAHLFLSAPSWPPDAQDSGWSSDCWGSSSHPEWCWSPSATNHKRKNSCKNNYWIIYRGHLCYMKRHLQYFNKI